MLTRKGGEARARPLSPDAEGLSLRGGAGKPRAWRAEAGLPPGLPGGSEPLVSGGVQAGAALEGGCGGRVGQGELGSLTPTVPSPVPGAGNSEMSLILSLPPGAPIGGVQTHISLRQS